MNVDDGVFTMYFKFIFLMRCAIWYHLHNLKNQIAQRTTLVIDGVRDTDINKV